MEFSSNGNVGNRIEKKKWGKEKYKKNCNGFQKKFIKLIK